MAGPSDAGSSWLSSLRDIVSEAVGDLVTSEPSITSNSPAIESEEVTLRTERARIYLDPTTVPPHPGDEWTRFVCVSDTHDSTPAVPNGDVLLHAGDISGGIPRRMKSMFDWLKSLPHETKVVIAGNHDLCLDEDWKIGGYMGTMGFTGKIFDELQEVVRGEDTQRSGVHYLEYESLEVQVRGKVWKIWGSPAAARHSFGAFQYETEEGAVAVYSKIPQDTEILLTHTPAKNILDETKRNVRAGCGVLARRLRELESCRLHVFGHIHEARGAAIGESDGKIHVNAAIGSRMRGQPVVVDLLNDLEGDFV